MDGKSNRRNKALFSNFFNIVTFFVSLFFSVLAWGAFVYRSPTQQSNIKARKTEPSNQRSLSKLSLGEASTTEVSKLTNSPYWFLAYF